MLVSQGKYYKKHFFAMTNLRNGFLFNNDVEKQAWKMLEFFCLGMTKFGTLYVSILHMEYKVKCVNDSLHFQVLLANFYLEKFSKTRKVRTYNLLILCYLTGFHVPKQLFEKFRKFCNSNTVRHQKFVKTNLAFQNSSKLQF